MLEIIEERLEDSGTNFTLLGKNDFNTDGCIPKDIADIIDGDDFEFDDQPDDEVKLLNFIDSFEDKETPSCVVSEFVYYTVMKKSNGDILDYNEYIESFSMMKGYNKYEVMKYLKECIDVPAFVVTMLSEIKGMI